MSSHCLRFMQLNINGLAGKERTLLQLLLKENIDICVLQEIKTSRFTTHTNHKHTPPRLHNARREPALRHFIPLFARPAGPHHLPRRRSSRSRLPITLFTLLLRWPRNSLSRWPSITRHHLRLPPPSLSIPQRPQSLLANGWILRGSGSRRHLRGL